MINPEVCEVRFLLTGGDDLPPCGEFAGGVVRLETPDGPKVGYACGRHSSQAYIDNKTRIQHYARVGMDGRPCTCHPDIAVACEWQIRADGNRVSQCLRCGGDRA